MRARIGTMVVLAASLLVAGHAVAQSDGSATFGGQWWNQTQPEARYQEYRALPRGGYLSDFVVREFAGKWAGSLWGTDASLKDQTNGFMLARGTKLRLDLKYVELPHLVSLVGTSPWAQVAPGVFRLPDEIQQQGQLANGANYLKGATNLLASSPGTTLGVQTDVSQARLRARPVKDWQFEVKGSDRERQGALAYGATFGMNNDVELPVPINQRTIDVDGTATYTHGPARVVASVGVSDFQNRVPTLTWDNPKALRDSVTNAVTGAGVGSQGRMALWPDNHVVRGNVTLAERLPMRSAFTATLSASQTEQDQAFVPLTINGKLVADTTNKILANSLAALPASNLGGKVIEVVQDYRLTGRPFAKFYGTLRYRDENNDDQTPALGFVYGLATTDQGIARTAVSSETASNRKGVFGLDADYDASRFANLSLLYENRTRTFDNREVDRDGENVYGARLRSLLTETVTLSGGVKYGQRRIHDLDTTAYNGTEQPLLRRYDVANRNQMMSDAALSWSPNEKLDLSVDGWWNRDDYPDTYLGLISSETHQISLDGALHVIRNLDLTGGFGYGQTQTEQRSDSTTTSPGVMLDDSTTWDAKLRDRTVFVFLRGEWWARPKKLQLVAECDFDRTFGQYFFSNPAQTPGQAPAAVVPAQDLAPYLYRTSDASLEARWHATTTLDLTLRYEYTRYDVDDALGGDVPVVDAVTTYNPATAASVNALWLGAERLSYTANLVRLMATRRF